jgi:hypothetical protein
LFIRTYLRRTYPDGAGFSPTLEFAISSAIESGSKVVFDADNTASHVIAYDGEVDYPACANIPNMIVVGASYRNNLHANYSPTHHLIDIVAPSHTAYDHQINGEGRKMC